MNDSAIFNLIIVSICIMVAIALSIIVLFNTSQRRIMSELQKAHDNKLSLQKMLLENTVAVQERERNRIARELHDNIGSQLSIMNLSLNVLKSLATFKPKELLVIDQISDSLTSSIETTRNISHELFPATISKFGINTALQALATSVERAGVIDVDMQISHEWEQIEQSKVIHIYRVVQELINNTIKHAEAENIVIKSWTEAVNIIIRYQDDGNGLSADYKNYKGIGLGNIQTRIGLLDGQFTLQNDQYGDGYKAIITIPFHKPTLSENGENV